MNIIGTSAIGVVHITNVDEGELVTLIEALRCASIAATKKAAKSQTNRKLRDDVERSEEASFHFSLASAYERIRAELMYGYDNKGTMGWNKS